VSDVVEQIEAKFGEAAPQMYFDYNLEGQWWAVPFHQRSGGGWYRTDAFEAAGIDLQKTRVYEQLREDCLAVSKPDEEFYGWGMTVNRSGDGDSVINRVKTGWGAAWQDETGQFITTNSPEMVDAMNFIKETYTDPKWEPMLPPGILSWNDTANTEAYLGGKIAYTQNAGTVYANAVLTESPVAPNTNFHKQCGGPVLQEFQVVGGQNWMVLRGSKNQAAAKETVLSFFTDVARYDEVLANSPSYALPCYTDLWELSEYIKTDPVAQQQQDACLDPSGIQDVYYPGPRTPAMDALIQSGIWNDMVNAVMTGTPAEDAVADAHTSMVALFQEFGLPGEQA
jgi:multiple sugar transport system substrate-binding protein